MLRIRFKEDGDSCNIILCSEVRFDKEGYENLPAFVLYGMDGELYGYIMPDDDVSNDSVLDMTFGTMLRQGWFDFTDESYSEICYDDEDEDEDTEPSDESDESDNSADVLGN